MITGHTHFERLDWRDGVLQINSGSAVHPHQWSTRLGTVALEIGPGSLRARIARLGETEGLKNPGSSMSSTARPCAASYSTSPRRRAGPGRLCGRVWARRPAGGYHRRPPDRAIGG